MGPAKLRRLTNAEYDNSLRGLLPEAVGTSTPSRALPFRGRWQQDEAAVDSVSPIDAESYLQVAMALAFGLPDDAVAALLGKGCEAAGLRADSRDDDGCAGGLASWFGARAYRRPLLDEERQILVEAYRGGRTLVGTTTGGVKALVLSVLQAPQFVYRAEIGQSGRSDALFHPTGHEVAARLSYFIWGDAPDDELTRAADAGKLTTQVEVAAQAQRLMADGRARSLTRRFYDRWLPSRPDNPDVVRSPMDFPTFTNAVRRDMAAEFDAFVDDHFWKTDSAVATLLTAPHTFLTPALADHYGLPRPPAGADPDAPTDVVLDRSRYAGILTQGALMTALSHDTRTSPVYRGKFVMEALLCSPLPAPPPDVVITPPDQIPPDVTTREALTIHTRNPPCASCHHLIDPIGFALEHFDPVGRWRDTERGKPVDSRVELDERLGWGSTSMSRTVAGAPDLASLLAQSEEVRSCMVRTWFRFAYGRTPDEGTDQCTLRWAEAGFAAGGFRLRYLVTLLTQTDAFSLNQLPTGVQR